MALLHTTIFGLRDIRTRLTRHLGSSRCLEYKDPITWVGPLNYMVFDFLDFAFSYGIGAGWLPNYGNGSRDTSTRSPGYFNAYQGRTKQNKNRNERERSLKSQICFYGLSLLCSSNRKRHALTAADRWQCPKSASVLMGAGADRSGSSRRLSETNLTGRSRTSWLRTRSGNTCIAPRVRYMG